MHAIQRAAFALCSAALLPWPGRAADVAAPAECATFSYGTRQTAIGNPPGTQVYDARSDCLLKRAMARLDESLCEQVIQWHFPFLDGSDISRENCLRSVRNAKAREAAPRAGAERIARLSAMRVDAAEGALTVELTLVANPSGTPLAASGIYALTLTAEIDKPMQAAAAGKPFQVHELVPLDVEPRAPVEFARLGDAQAAFHEGGLITPSTAQRHRRDIVLGADGTVIVLKVVDKKLQAVLDDARRGHPVTLKARLAFHAGIDGSLPAQPREAASTITAALQLR